MEEQNVDRTIFVTAQLMRINIRIDGKQWKLTGTPADNPLPTDEMAESQLEVSRIYEQYNLYKVGKVDEVMGWIEKRIGRWINARRKRKSWSREGMFE